MDAPEVDVGAYGAGLHRFHEVLGPGRNERLHHERRECLVLVRILPTAPGGTGLGLDGLIENPVPVPGGHVRV